MRSKDGWRRSWGDEDQVLNTAKGDQWKLCNPNGTQCRMLQCAILLLLFFLLLCYFLVFVCDVFHVPLMNVA